MRWAGSLVSYCLSSLTAFPGWYRSPAAGPTAMPIRQSSFSSPASLERVWAPYMRVSCSFSPRRLHFVGRASRRDWTHGFAVDVSWVWMSGCLVPHRPSEAAGSGSGGRVVREQREGEKPATGAAESERRGVGSQGGRAAQMCEAAIAPSWPSLQSPRL